MPCLVSRPKQPGNRKTQYTVEALSLSHPDEEAKAWFGINQSASTRYIGHFMSLGAFPEIAAQPGLVQAERKVSHSGNLHGILTGFHELQMHFPVGCRHICKILHASCICWMSQEQGRQCRAVP